jgi:formylglycine-generating enzyme required for sulfatase activity
MRMENLGDYQIQRQLGVGAFGEIYLAEHRFIRRPFVLKVLPFDVTADSVWMRQLEEQVHAIAALDHPHIVKIHNISSADGRFFIVEDPVIDSLGEAMNLERYLALKGPSLAEEDYLMILRQVASALDYSHDKMIGSRQFIHGALNLANILVACSDTGIRVLLSDLGLTQLMGDGLAFVRICEKAALSLTPSSFSSKNILQMAMNFARAFGFLAPEQKYDHPVDGRADSYAFGVLAYFLAARRIPEGCFDLPSKILCGTQFDWDSLVSRCLQINPDSRPAHLMSVLNDCMKPSVNMQALDTIALGRLQVPLHAEMQLSVPSQKEHYSAGLAQTPNSAAPKPLPKLAEITRLEPENSSVDGFHRESHVSQYVLRKTESSDIEPLLTEVAIIPGGTYVRGSLEGARDEMPRHAVMLASFAVDIHPVTNEQFVRFLQAMGGEKDHNNNDIIRLRDSRIKRSVGKLLIESEYAKHPVVGVTWYGAVAYAKWIGKRLPTEAEWEAAASCGKEANIYPAGAEIDRSQANFFGSDTTAVMSYSPNDLGLYDMPGNVYEWCQDWYAYNYYEASSLEPEYPKGPQQGVYRVLRGGCWKSLKEDLRCSHRHRNNPGAANSTYGFRCVTDVQP